MGSTGSNSSRMSKVTDFDVEDFNFFDIRSGKYAYELAQEMNEYGEDDTLFTLKENNNVAYAAIDDDSDTLDGIISTGGGVGTKLFIQILERQQKNNKSLTWLAQEKSARNYYTSLGLNSYIVESDSNSTLYTIPANKIADAIKKLRG